MSKFVFGSTHVIASGFVVAAAMSVPIWFELCSVVIRVFETMVIAASPFTTVVGNAVVCSAPHFCCFF